MYFENNIGNPISGIIEIKMKEQGVYVVKGTVVFPISATTKVETESSKIFVLDDYFIVG